jgi:hypothetical protein
VILAWLLALSALGAGVAHARAGDDAYDAVQALLGERRLSDAFDLLPEIRDPLLGARAEAELFYLARDFPRCLAAVDAGLAQAPRDLLLLHRALTASLWLRDGRRSTDWCAELAGAVAAADLGPEERAWWDESLAALRANAGDLLESARARDRRVALARAVSLSAIAGTLVGLALLARAPRAAQG